MPGQKREKPTKQKNDSKKEKKSLNLPCGVGKIKHFKGKANN